MVDRIRYPTVSYLPFYYIFFEINFQFLFLTIFNLQAKILAIKDILSNLGPPLLSPPPHPPPLPRPPLEFPSKSSNPRLFLNTSSLAAIKESNLKAVWQLKSNSCHKANSGNGCCEAKLYIQNLFEFKRRKSNSRC